MTLLPNNLSQLALHGGPKVRTDPWPHRGHIGLEEKAAVDAFLDRVITGDIPPGYMGYNGPEETAYCEEFAQSMGGGYADGVNSGSVGLYVALKALALRPFTEVIVGAVTDPGGMMPIPLLNLVPIVADTVPGGYNTGPEQVEALISPLTSAIAVAHIAGEPADMEGIMAVARKRGIPVVEDCAQAHGATLYGKPVGSFGDVAFFSTLFGKHHCTGGQGGVVYTRHEAIYQAIRRSSDRGKPFFLPAGTTNVVASLNLNLTDMAAAMGRVQLRKLPEQVKRRRAIVERLNEGIQGLEVLSIPPPIPGAEPSYWFLRVEFHADKATCDKETFCQALGAEGLPVDLHYRGALPHLMDWFVNRRVFGESGYPWTSPDYDGDPDRQFPCPNAQASMDSQFNLRFHENWGEREVADAVAILRKVGLAYRGGRWPSCEP
ncbi:MAG: DegT/DnrJ/EryC1/StrS family aminotransferase [Anaerolineae bacterium]|nr:DegT/DnrJ/EryC1/StrS family aminotransferase [Anaerolineae bacterium]